MMSKKWNFLGCCVVCLLALSLNASALVTDPNIISGWAKINSVAEEPLAKGSITEGALTHVDRTFVFDNVAEVNGIDLLMTAVDDKANANLEYSVTLDKAGTLFLLIDPRVGDNDATNPPTLGGGIMDWVDANGFTQTPHTASISGNPPLDMVLYARDVAAGTYNTYAQNDGTGRVTYLIAAIPNGYNLPPAINGVPLSATLILPDNELPIDATVTDVYGDNIGVSSVLWEQLDANPAVSFSPNATTEDVTITFSDEGVYTLRLTATDGDGATSSRSIEVTISYTLFAASCQDGNYDVELGNDGSLSYNSRTLTSSGVGMRNIPTRRRVTMIDYDLSALGALGTNEVFANTALSVLGYNSGATVSVYGVREALDTYSMSSATWATAPGLPNTPVPPSDSPVTLDAVDLTGKLMEFTAPGAGVRETTAVSPSLAEFLSDDTDGHVILLFAALTDGDSCIVRSRNYTSSGTGYTLPGETTEYHGVVLVTQKRVPTWATNPVPANYSAASQLLTTVSWTNPPEPVGTVTCDVYFGTEPNELLPNLGLTLIADDTAGTSATVSLAADTTYYWFVDATDSGTGITSSGNLWTFDTYNAAPEVSAGDDQYIWLNNNGDPATSTTTLDGTVTDDGKPSGIINYLWEQISGTDVTFNDPNNLEDVSITLPGTGTYSFRLTANDTVLSASDIVQVIVEDTPCEAAQAKPGYEDTVGDVNSDCYVNLVDVALLADNWLVCHPFMDAPCVP